MQLNFSRIEDLPGELPLFPLNGVLLLPRGRLPLNIFERRYLAMFDDALAGERLIGIIQPSDPLASERSPALYRIGCAGRITSFQETGDGRYIVSLDGVCRFSMAAELEMHRGYRRATPDWSVFTRDFQEETCAIDRPRLTDLLRAYFRLQGLSANWEVIGQTPDERLITSLAMICPFEPPEKQALLEASCLSDRLKLMMGLLEIAVAGHGSEDGPRH